MRLADGSVFGEAFLRDFNYQCFTGLEWERREKLFRVYAAWRSLRNARRLDSGEDYFLLELRFKERLEEFKSVNEPWEPAPSNSGVTRYVCPNCAQPFVYIEQCLVEQRYWGSDCYRRHSRIF